MEWKKGQKDTDGDRKAEGPTGVYCALTGRGNEDTERAAIENRGGGKHLLRPQAPRCLPPSPYLLELRAQGIHP